MSQTFTKALLKMLTAVFVFSVIVASLPATAAESKNSIDDLKKIQNNIREKDPQKIQSEKLTKKNKDVQVSNQKDLDIEIDSSSKQIRVNKKSKGNTTIGIPGGNLLTDVQTIDNQVIFSNKNAKFDVIAEVLDGGVRQVINIKDSSAPTEYDFPITLESGDKIVVNDDGSVTITAILSDKEKAKREELSKTAPVGVKIPDFNTKLLIAKPWAKDANRKELKTSYSVVGSNLRQTIELKDAVFPIVADPIWCGNTVSSTNRYYNNSSTYPGEYGWSLAVYPSGCGVAGAYMFTTPWSNVWFSWQDVCNASGTGWYCNYWSNDEYWSMFDQYACHYNIIGVNKQYVTGSSERVYNLDIWRPRVSWATMLAKFCNPK